MNLLFVLLRNMEADTRSKLNTVTSRGTVGKVWQLINEQATKGDFDKNEIIKQTGISPSHLDKITSELLAKCYAALFGNDVLALLDFLSSRVTLIRSFYQELARQMKVLPGKIDKQELADIIRQCFRMIHNNMPMAYRDHKASARLAKLYISLFRGVQKKEAEFSTLSIMRQTKKK